MRNLIKFFEGEDDMFRIEDKETHLLVILDEDFDYPMLRTMLYRVMKQPEFRHRNDIWLIGKHRAHLHYDELRSIVDAVMMLYPENAERSRTALVIDPGLTEAIAELFLNAGRSRLPFEMRRFGTLEEAQRWIGVSGGRAESSAH